MPAGGPLRSASSAAYSNMHPACSAGISLMRDRENRQRWCSRALSLRCRGIPQYQQPTANCISSRIDAIGSELGIIGLVAIFEVCRVFQLVIIDKVRQNGAAAVVLLVSCEPSSCARDSYGTRDSVKADRERGFDRACV